MKKKYNLMKKTPTESVLYFIVFAVFCLVSFTYIYMIGWCFFAGLRTSFEVATNPFGFSSIDFRNYLTLFTMMQKYGNGTSFLGMILNSMYFSVLGSACNIIITTMFAYVCCKYKFPGSNLIYTLVIVVITMPIYGSSASQYKLMFNLGFINSRAMIFSSFGGMSMNFLYIFAFFSSVSWSYAEAAQMDGANDWQIFYRVMFPQSLSMVGSLYLLLWISEWNNYGTALIYLPKLPTLAVGIYQFKLQMQFQSQMNILYAACFVSLIPPLVLFVACNGALMKNISLGGIKE